MMIKMILMIILPKNWVQLFHISQNVMTYLDQAHFKDITILAVSITAFSLLQLLFLWGFVALLQQITCNIFAVRKVSPRF